MKAHAQIQSFPASLLGVKTEAVASAMIAALFGVFLLYGVGFSPAQAAHDAAHDSRHAMAYPCH